MRRLDALPRVLTTETARNIGVSRASVRHRLDTGQWRPMTRGAVLTRPEPPRREDWAMLGLLVAGPDSALSGWDAIRLRGCGARTPPTDRVLVLTRSGHHRRLGRVLIRPTVRPCSTWLLPPEHETLPWAQVAAPARALADTALSMLRPDEVRALVAASVQRRVCCLDDLRAELERIPRAGSGPFRRAIGDVSDGARSVAEALASDRLRAARVPAYELNVPIVCSDGVVVAEVDVLWRALRAVLEVDSRQHHVELDDWQATQIRHNALNRVRFAIEHHAPVDIREGGKAWSNGVRRWLQARAAEMRVPYVPGRGPLPPGPDGPPPVRLEISSGMWLR